MKWKWSRAVGVASAIGIVLASAAVFLKCGERNHAPQIIQYGASYTTISVNELDELWCDAVDADSDALSYEWNCSDGTVTPFSEDGTVAHWRAPGEPGADTVSVSVTDEHGAVVVGEKRITVVE